MSANGDTLGLPFDQYQRYRLVADVLRGIEASRPPARTPAGLRILDVGGRTALLRRFYPAGAITLVDVEASAEPGLVLGDGAHLPFRDGAFDVVATFDTLEHVPPPARDAFLAECRRVARGFVVVAGPFDTPRVAEAEAELRAFLEQKLETRHRYLEEHHTHGLPSLEGTTERLAGLGGRVHAVAHGNVERWLALMSIALYLDRDAPLRALATRFHRFYNEAVYRSDTTPPVYRHAVIAAFDGSDPAAIAPAFEVAGPALGALEPLRRFAQELLRFDAQRDVVQREWERLTEVNEGLVRDLRGHERKLAELERLYGERGQVALTLEEDLAGHQRRVHDLEAELAAVRADARRGREEAAAAEGALRTDLEQHAAALARAETELAEHKRVLAAREGELAEHAATLHAVRDSWTKERGAFESIVAQLRGEIAAGVEVRDHLARELAARATYEQQLVTELERTQTAARAIQDELLTANEGAQAIQRDLLAALEGLSATRSDLAAMRSELAGTQGTLAAEQLALQHSREAFAAQRERLEAREAELFALQRAASDMRLVLNSRWQSLRRALGLRKPRY